MKNTITITIPFSFKGKEFKPSSKINLDDFCQQNHDFNLLYHVVATENKIDNYSYEYEVLQASTLLFSDAEGVAESFLVDGVFDLEGFCNNIGEYRILGIVQKIAKDVLDIDNIEEHEQLKQALQQAYHAGKDD